MSLDVAETIVETGTGPAVEERILHRDVSAGNIIVDGGGRGVLIDYHVASVGPIGSVGTHLTGTPLFLAIHLGDVGRTTHGVVRSGEPLLLPAVHLLGWGGEWAFSCYIM